MIDSLQLCADKEVHLKVIFHMHVKFLELLCVTYSAVAQDTI